MAGETKQQIIIKKIKKAGHGHHGGAWKIAYADFVTAMMAFFLLLWLLNSVTQEQLAGISNYFAPVTASSSTSGSGDILGGKTITEEGAAQNSTSRDSVTVDLPPPKAGTGGGDGEDDGASGGDSESEAEAEQLKKVEEQLFDQVKDELENAMASLPQMRQLQKSLLIDNTPEGLRIQIVDSKGLSMFPSGSAEMYQRTKIILELVSKVIATMPQHISIAGHTDSVPFTNEDYGNWELSADRANAARRAIVHFNVSEDRIDRVEGKAATEPLLPDDTENAQNRRLSITLLRGTGDQKLDPSDAVQNQSNPVSLDPDRSEKLPGLNEIRRRQLGGEGENNPAPSFSDEALPGLSIELQPSFEAQ